MVAAQGEHRAQRRRTAVRWKPCARTTITLAAALIIALLNPLLCLFHCAFAHRHAALTSEQQHFLCDLGADAPALITAPFAAVWGGPRAVYEAAPLAGPLLFLVVVLVASLVAAADDSCEYIPPPAFPPPK